MNDDEKSLFKELIQSNNERVAMTKSLIRMVFILIITIVLCFSVTISVLSVSHDKSDSIISQSHDRAIEECTRLYFQSDYDYGEINNSTDIQLTK